MSIKTIVPHSSIAESKIDVALMSAKHKLLLGMIELKNNLSRSALLTAQMQTVSYALCALAYSRWGVWRRKEPLVSLLVTPTVIFRFTFKKPDKKAFGLDMTIEKATDTTMMESVLRDYINDFVLDYNFVSKKNLEEKLFNRKGPIEPVNPVDWTSINLKDVSTLARDPNLGFLFTATGDAVNKMQEISKFSQIPALQPDMPIIIKCLSAVLEIRYEECASAIDHVVKALSEKQKLLAEKQKLLAEKQARLAEKQARLAIEIENARLQHLLESHGKGDRTGGTPSQMGREAADPVSEDSEPAPEEVEEIKETAVKHPYLIVGTVNAHPFFVMRDMGITLHDLVYGPGSDFCARWRGSPVLRAAFLEDVGLTALNLVTECEVCHNDIRLPNIAFKDGRFCLLDFDMSHKSLQFQKNSAFSPKMTAAVNWMNPPAEQMCYSVAQVAVNVFVLDTPEGSVAGTDPAAASCIWSMERDGSAVDAAFERWAAAKGVLVLGFVAAVREACQPPKRGRVLRFVPPADYKGYFAQVLRDMLA